MTTNEEDIPFNLIPKKNTLKPICKIETLTPEESSEEYEFDNMRKIYAVERLNRQQREVYDYVLSHPDEIILLQAGPGTGKTFTMLTMACNMNVDVNVIIYKHDLLENFKICAKTHTVASFCMKLWGLKQFYKYKSLDIQSSTDITSEVFINMIIGLIKNANVKFLERSLVIIDEYTVISKVLLFAMLEVFRLHGIGVIICGDRNQLQNVHNSMHMGNCSSYDISVNFCSKTFELSKNERCTDIEYNKFLSYISKFSSDRKIDNIGYIIATAVFAKKLFGTSTIHDTIIANYHRDVQERLHRKCYSDGKNPIVPVSYYFIDGSKVRETSRINGIKYKNSSLYIPYVATLPQHKWKYIPYIPIIVGGYYFVREQRERNIAILKSYDPIAETVEMCNVYDKKVFILHKESSNDVLFEKHRTYLLGWTTQENENNGMIQNKLGLGLIYNFPIYLATTMSMYMCQGRTIATNVDIILNNCTYQGFYVVASRVTSPDFITHVSIPYLRKYVLSMIINFPQLCHKNDLSIDEIDRKLRSNFILYDINISNNHDNYIMALAIEFLFSEIKNEMNDEKKQILTRKKYLYDLITSFVMKNLKKQEFVNFDQSNCISSNINDTNIQNVTTNGNINNNEYCEEFEPKNNADTLTIDATISLLLPIKNTLLALSLFNECMVAVWVREYLLTKQWSMIKRTNKNSNVSLLCKDLSLINKYSDSEQKLQKLCNLNFQYKPEESTFEYIWRTASYIDLKTSNNKKGVKYSKCLITYLCNTLDEENNEKVCINEFLAKIFNELKSKLVKCVDMKMLTFNERYKKNEIKKIKSSFTTMFLRKELIDLLTSLNFKGCNVTTRKYTNENDLISEINEEFKLSKCDNSKDNNNDNHNDNSSIERKRKQELICNLFPIALNVKDKDGIIKKKRKSSRISL